jgi:hypothetical protein
LEQRGTARKIERKGDREVQGGRQVGIRAEGNPRAKNGARKEGETRKELRMKETRKVLQLTLLAPLPPDMVKRRT